MEEALYWNSRDVLILLLERGATVQKPAPRRRLGRTEFDRRIFNATQPEGCGGQINWPGVDWKISPVRITIKPLKTKPGHPGQRVVADASGIITTHCLRLHARTIEPQGCSCNTALEISVVPGGFDYAGTGYITPRSTGNQRWSNPLAAGCGTVREGYKGGSDAAGWAEHGGHLSCGTCCGIHSRMALNSRYDVIDA